MDFVLSLHKKIPKNLKPAVASHSTRTQKPLQRSSTTPDTRVAEARLKVVKLEKALEVFEGTDGKEVEEGPGGSQSCRPREACHRADHRMQEFHRLGRETRYTFHSFFHFFHNFHGPRLYVCQAPNALICVSPNASAESTEFASLAYLCSLRSHVF